MTEHNENVSFRNVRYVSDTEYTISIARTLLTPIGIWPLYRSDTFWNNVKMSVHVAAVFSLMCFLLIPNMIYVAGNSESLAQNMKVYVTQIFSLLGVAKFWSMILNRKQIGRCLRAVAIQYRDTECEADRIVMTKAAKIGRFFTIVYLSLSYGGGLPYHIVLPFMSEKVVKRDNTTQIPLPYISDYVFFVIEDTPIYEITFVLQMVISTMVMSSNTGVNTLIATTVMHTYGLFEVVNRKIETFFEDDINDLHDRLNNIVQHHLKAIEFADMIQKGFNIIFLAELGCCTLIICFLEYGVIMNWEDRQTFGTMTYFTLMMSSFVNVYIISSIGDRLKQESERIGRTLYFLPWYDLPRDVVNNIKMVMLRTTHPTYLTAANIFDLSLQTFCDICKTSAAYLNFLRAMTE
ncbi:odorant receptor 43a-like [Colletes gigas]|uniref:odorant receptor 43a-like n=1 Tax=Colletes gigas TaxID=935657 RepID=UPI001C9A5B35|nr:odorant receptor 43a-like [Colletes gigas]